MTQHRIALGQVTRPRHQLVSRQAGRLGNIGHVFLGMGQEFVQRRIQEADRAGTLAHDAEDLCEVIALHGQDLVQRRDPAVLVIRQDHLAHGGDPVGFEEHVLGPAQADALGAELDRGLAIIGRFRIGPHFHAAGLVGPDHELAEITGQLRLDHLGLAHQDLARGAVDGDHVAILDDAATDHELLVGIVDLDRPGTGDTRPAHAACHHGGMRGHATAGGDDAFGGVHAVNVFRRGLDAHENDFLARLGAFLGLVTVEHDLARGSAWRCRQARGEDVALGVGIEGRVQELVKLGRIDPHHRFIGRDQAFGCHVDGNLQRRLGGALAIAGLQHPQPAAFDRELDVLHVGIMAFQLVEDSGQFGIAFRHRHFHRRVVIAHLLAHRLGQALRRADAGDYVLALGVDQVFAVIAGITGRGVTGEGHTGGRSLTHIAEHHGLDIDRRAPARRNVVQAAIGLGAIGHPGAENGANGTPELLARIGREITAQLAGSSGLVLTHNADPVIRAQLGVEGVVIIVLEAVENVLEDGVIHAQDNVGIHLDEAAITVIGEAAIARELGQPLGGFVIQTQIEHRIHHARHRGAGARPDRNQKRIGGIAKRLADRLFQPGERRLDLATQRIRIGLVIVIESRADLRGQGETRRDRQAQLGHLGEVGALAAQQLAHAGFTFTVAAAKGVNPLGICSHERAPSLKSCRNRRRREWPCEWRTIREDGCSATRRRPC